MLPTFTFFRLVIPVPILTILAGIWIGLSVTERFCQRNGISANTLYNLVFATLISSAVTARMFYVLAYPKIFLGDPLSIVSPSVGLFDPWGAAAGGLVAFIAYTQQSKNRINTMLDALTPALAIFALAFHLSNFASGSGYGTTSSVPWAINLLGMQRHPVQIYEAVGAALIFLVLWRNWLTLGAIPGRDFFQFIAVSACARLFFEFFHADSQLVAGQFRLVQIAAWLILALCLIALHRLEQKSPQSVQATYPQ